MKKLSPALLFFFLISLSANAQLELIKDINLMINGSSSSPSSLTEWNGSLYFISNDGTHGSELWKSDGSAEGTVLIKDIRSGTLSSSINQIIAFNGALYFSANDGVAGQELWKTDGTAEGTVLVKDIRSGISGAFPDQFTVFNATLYFTANDGVTGSELWKTDGTATGTVLVKDIDPGNNGILQGFKAFNGALYFTATDGVTGQELWKTDGTAAGTVLVKDISTGTGHSFPQGFTPFNGALYFTANEIGVTGQELWKTDGTAAGTVLVKDIFNGTNGSGPQQLTVFNGAVYFSAFSTVAGYELWKTDGTQEGTVLVKDIRIGTDGSSIQQLTVFNGAVYFNANDGISGQELWKTDGTAAGTVLVKDISSGTNSGSPFSFRAFNGTLYFSADNGINGTEFWKTDGITTLMVKDIFAGPNGSSPSQFTMVDGAVYFSANNGINGTELWITDGTSDGTELVKDIVSATTGSNPSGLTSYNGAYYFAANDGISGQELWKTDGTAEGTVLVKDIRSGISSAFPGQFTVFNGALYFSADDGINGQELWKTNGTADGTVLVKDIRIGINGSSLQQLTVFNGAIYFTADDGFSGREIWKTDGTTEGTVLVKDIFSGINGAQPQQLTVFNGAVYFGADDGISGRELWKTDGTAEGTVLVKDISAGGGFFSSGSPSLFTVLNETLFFQASNNISGQELWKTDGTAEGTVLVKDIAAGIDGSVPQGLTTFNGALYFNATDGVTGQELWKSDGTAEGTVLVKDIFVGPNGGGPFQVTGYNGTLFFSANEETHGAELWKSDGTTAGTMLVMDIVSGSGSGSPSNFKVVGDAVYFSSGGNLWKTQGSACNTVMVATGNLSFPIAFGSEIIGTSNNVLLGNELFKYDTSNDPVTNCKPTVQASNIIISNILSDQATIRFTKGNGTHRAVLVRGDLDREAVCVPKSGNIFLNGNSDFSSGSNFCLASRQYKVVYADTGSVVHVTGLFTNKMHEVLVMEFNRDAGIDYLLTAGVPKDTVSTIVTPNVYVTTPANGAVNQKIKLNVAAKSVTGATTYTIEISPNSDFSSDVISKSGGRTQAFDSLSYGTEYFTRVKTNLRPDFGTITSFTTIGAEQLAYVITPKNLAVNQKVEVSVTSNIVPVATEYTIELNTLENFTGASIVQTGGKTQMFDSLEYATTYYTRVKTELSENWGAIRSFTTLDAASISYVITPKDAAINQKTNLNVTANTVPNATEYTIELTTLAGDTLVQTGGRTQLFSGLHYNTTYYSRVKTEFAETWGATRSFTTVDAASLSYVTAPANNAVNLNTTLNVSSYTVPGATEYTIQLSESSEFDTIKFERIGSTRTLAFSGLKYNTVYYNRVRTNFSAPDSWGVVRSFKTRTAESLAYVTSPANGAVDRKTNLSISSNTVPGATSYTIQLSGDSLFSVIASEVTGATRTLAFTGLNGGTKYYNRVTTNAPGTVGFGQVRSFTTIGVPPGARLSSPTPGDQIESEELQVETEELKEFDVQVYPNPFREKLIFHIEARVEKQAKVTLMDVNGKAIHESIEQTNTTVEIEKPLSVGVYLLRVTSGTQYKMIRVVKSD